MNLVTMNLVAMKLVAMNLVAMNFVTMKYVAGNWYKVYFCVISSMNYVNEIYVKELGIKTVEL